VENLQTEKEAGQTLCGLAAATLRHQLFSFAYSLLLFGFLLPERKVKETRSLRR
jgi:hypothetical protein